MSKARKNGTPNPGEKLARISFRLDAGLTERLELIVEVSRRTRTSILEECLEEELPGLETRYLGHQTNVRRNP